MILEFKNAGLKFGDSEVLRDLNFSIAEGEAVGIVGRSGVGKSSMLQVAAGLQILTSGEVLFRGEAITRPSLKVGLIFQDHALLPWKNAWENVAFPLKARGVEKPEYYKTAMQWLEVMQMADAAKKFPAELSGGMCQRVGVARALCASADLLLLDEAFSNIDSFTAAKLKSEIFPMLRRLKKTVIYVTHDLESAIRWTDRVLLLKDGRVAIEVSGQHHDPAPIQITTTRDKLYQILSQER